jgi:hypothetical protein
MQGGFGGKLFDRGDCGAMQCHGKLETGIDTTSVNQNRAGAALPMIAALFRPGQMKPLAKKVEKSDFR